VSILPTPLPEDLNEFIPRTEAGGDIDWNSEKIGYKVRSMRIFLIVGLFVCLGLTGCEFFTPNTSQALSQTQQLEEMQRQTEQLQRQADALEQLVNRARGTQL
jgi:type II secretory pathway component PulM